MKKFVFFFILCICMTSCSSNKENVTIINVPEGEKVISVGQSQSITVFLTEPMEENYKPTEKTLYKINAFGGVSKWAIFRETK